MIIYLCGQMMFQCLIAVVVTIIIIVNQQVEGIVVEGEIITLIL